MIGENLRDIDRLVESNREQRRQRIEREDREDKLLIERNLETYREEYNEYIKKTPITYEDYVRVKNHKITFVPKKKTKLTLERKDFPEERRRGLLGEETEDFLARIVMFVGVHHQTGKHEAYDYGSIRFTLYRVNRQNRIGTSLDSKRTPRPHTLTSQIQLQVISLTKTKMSGQRCSKTKKTETKELKKKLNPR